jgi:hypothetical protein
LGRIGRSARAIRIEAYLGYRRDALGRIHSKSMKQ